MTSRLLLTTASTIIDDVDLVADDNTCMCRSSVDRLLVVCKLRVCTGFYRLILMCHLITLTVRFLVLRLGCDCR